MNVADRARRAVIARQDQRGAEGDREGKAAARAERWAGGAHVVGGSRGGACAGGGGGGGGGGEGGGGGSVGRRRPPPRGKYYVNRISASQALARRPARLSQPKRALCCRAAGRSDSDSALPRRNRSSHRRPPRPRCFHATGSRSDRSRPD